MPRKGAVSKREILPDPKYHDRLVSKFVNSMMEDGKRSVAERLLYSALDVVAERAKDEALGLFRKPSKRQASGRSSLPASWWRNVSGACRGSPVATRLARHALDRAERAVAR